MARATSAASYLPPAAILLGRLVVPPPFGFVTVKLRLVFCPFGLNAHGLTSATGSSVWQYPCNEPIGTLTTSEILVCAQWLIYI